MNSPYVVELSVVRRITRSFVLLGVLVSLYLQCLAILFMVHAEGSYVLWAVLSSSSVLIALLGIPVYYAATSSREPSSCAIEGRGDCFSVLPLFAAMVAFCIGGLWMPIAALLAFCGGVVYFLFTPIERAVSNMLCRWELDNSLN